MRRIQDLFLEVRSASLADAERLLQSHETAEPEVVEKVRELLRIDGRPGILDVPAHRLQSPARPAVPDDMPARVGTYRIVGEIGHGGMGSVYLGERDDGQFRQRVAIKLIRSTDPDDEMHRRFLAERRILADLDHPNIARLLDGGITDDGRPFLAMEYIEGQSLTDYCDRHALDLRSRLALFIDVCAAVQHAHQKLIVHRDLKPGNILVSNDGRVHLLDFGIAKLVGDRAPAGSALTRIDQRVMTPSYASPEQVRGDGLTTASDIYSLGVVLYELLCGRSPYRLTGRAPHEIATAVCDQDPDRPSARIFDESRDEGFRADEIAATRGMTTERLARRLRGELDSIVLKALRKEPERRYASVDMLREDVERHLGGQPVLAHRGSRRYRIEKFVRRHRVEATAAAIVLLALIGGLGTAIEQSRQARADRDRAERALAESEGVTNFLLDLYRSGDSGNPPGDLTALELLRRGALRANELADQPIVHARLLDVVGQMSLALGLLDEAQRQLEQAVNIRRATLGDRSIDLAASLIHLSWVHRARVDYESARPLVAEALDIRRSTLPPGHPDIGSAIYELGWLHYGTDQEVLYREALTSLPDTGSSAELRVTVYQALSTNLRRQGRLSEAVEADRQALRFAESRFGPEHHVTGYARIHLADHVADIEQDDSTAEQLYRRGLESITRRFGENSVRLIHGLHGLGRLLASRNDDGAEPLFRRSLAIRQASTGPEHAAVADELHWLAAELARQRRLTEADSLARQALDLSVRTLGRTHPVVPNERMPLIAEVLELQGRHLEADRMYLSAIEETPFTGVIPGQLRRGYGLLLMRRGDYEGAEVQLLHSLRLLDEAYAPADHPNAAETRRALMMLYRAWGRPELVERYRVPPGRYIPY